MNNKEIDINYKTDSMGNRVLRYPDNSIETRKKDINYKTDSMGNRVPRDPDNSIETRKKDINYKTDSMGNRVPRYPDNSIDPTKKDINYKTDSMGNRVPRYPDNSIDTTTKENNMNNNTQRTATHRPETTAEQVKKNVADKKAKKKAKKQPTTLDQAKKVKNTLAGFTAGAIVASAIFGLGVADRVIDATQSQNQLKVLYTHVANYDAEYIGYVDDMAMSNLNEFHKTGDVSHVNNPNNVDTAEEFLDKNDDPRYETLVDDRNDSIKQAGIATTLTALGVIGSKFLANRTQYAINMEQSFEDKKSGSNTPKASSKEDGMTR